MTISSIYRDSFPEKVLLLDKAVRLANDAPAEAGLANHVQANTQRLARELAGSGASPEASRSLTLLRIFGDQTGQYGTGVDGVIDASESWTQRSEVATAGLERLAEYILRCPFSLARVVRLTDDGSVIYHAEKDHCRRFPGPASADLRGGPRRNFQVFTALDFLAEVTQHIPDKGEHLVCYYGWYSHRRRGLHAKPPRVGLTEHEAESVITAESGSIRIDRSALAAQRSADGGPRAGNVSTWARLIRRVFEVDPLACPQCGGAMKIISFIERRQQAVIERILRHCGLWEGPLRTLAHPRAPPAPADPDEDQPRELQLVLDPEFL